MKKPKDVDDLAGRLMQAATAPLMTASPPLPAEWEETPEPPAARNTPEPQAATRLRKKPEPNRSTRTVYLRIPGVLFEKYDNEAVRRTKATGRGVTVQQVILDELAGTKA